jgi:hypothetical protein
MSTNLEITIDEHSYDDLEHRGWQHRLVLTPGDKPSIHVFSAVGTGAPEAVWHGRAQSWRLPACTSNSLRLWIEANSEDFVALAAEYRGAEFDGSNRVGRWSDKAVDLAEHIALALHGAELETRWLAADWFEPSAEELRGEVASMLEEGKDVDAIAEHYLDEALSEGAVLEPGDVQTYLSNVVAELKIEAEDQAS